MIDVEIGVFDYVYPNVAPLVPDGCFKSMYVPNPSTLPFATLMEVDNITDTRHRSSARNEDYAIVTYEANVYADNKSECRSVMDAIDTSMMQLGFTRTSMLNVPNLLDPALYRITARYRAAANADNIIFRTY